MLVLRRAAQWRKFKPFHAKAQRKAKDAKKILNFSFAPLREIEPDRGG
jgi:hypothetical protein